MLDGYGWLLEDQTSRLPKVNKFLEKVPEYQVGWKRAIKERLSMTETCKLCHSFSAKDRHDS